jgi:hypothetical protein
MRSLPLLSAKCSNLPALHLPIARSRLPVRLGLLGCLGGVLASLILLRADHLVLAALLPPLSVLCCWPARTGPRVTGIEWHDGQWFVWRGDVKQAVNLRRGSVCLPGLICFAWSDADGSRARSWLFADSAPAAGLRRLRVRLRLEA